MRILLAEDDDDVAAELSTALERHGYQVTRVADGASAIASHQSVDLILLDLTLPDLDGLEVCRRIRRASAVPIIVVSARVDEMDRVLALKSGADDFVGKPYGFWELSARIEALMRRVHALIIAPRPMPTETASDTLRIGAMSVDLRQRRVQVDGADVELTRTEFDLLTAFASEPGTVFERQLLLRQVWGTDWVGSSRVLDVHVNSLRRKLGRPSLIETVRGVGFRLAGG